jgi:hypothetical protein
VVDGNYLLADGCLGCPDQAESGQKKPVSGPKIENVRAEEAARPLKATTRNAAVERVTRIELA